MFKILCHLMLKMTRIGEHEAAALMATIGRGPDAGRQITWSMAAYQDEDIEWAHESGVKLVVPTGAQRARQRSLPPRRGEKCPVICVRRAVIHSL